jgi:GGDEF domain-containing protein
MAASQALAVPKRVIEAPAQRLSITNPVAGQSYRMNPQGVEPGEVRTLKDVGRAAHDAFVLWDAQGTKGVNGILYWLNDMLEKTNAPVLFGKSQSEENKKLYALQMDLASDKARGIMEKAKAEGTWYGTVVTMVNGGLSLLQSLAMGTAVRGGQVVGRMLANVSMKEAGAIAVSHLAKQTGYKAAMTAFKKVVDTAVIQVGMPTAASWMPAWISSAIEGGDIYRERTIAGISPLRSSITAGLSIAGTALSEAIELDGMYRTWSRNVGSELAVRFTNALGQAISETGQEIGQGIWQNVIQRAVGLNGEQAIMSGKELLDTIIGIFPSSLLFGAGTFNAAAFRQQYKAETAAITSAIKDTFGVDDVTAGKMLDEAVTKIGPAVRDVFLTGLDTKEVKLSDVLTFERTSDPFVQFLVKKATKPVAAGKQTAAEQTLMFTRRPRISATPQISPSVAISPQGASVPTPPSGIAPQIAPIAESQVGRRTVAPMTRQYVQTEMKRLVDAGDTAGAQALIEQVRNEGRIDTLTGLKNRVGWEEADKQGKIVASGDVSGLKYVNDTYGHDFGDSLLKMVAAAFQANSVDAYRPHGDEFLALFASQEEADTGMAAVQQTLSEQELLVTINGVTKALRGWRIDYGTGQDYASADAALLADRADREAKGLRPARGTNPLGTPAVAAQGVTAPTTADRTVSKIRPRAAEEIAPPSTEQSSVVPTEKPATTSVAKLGRRVVILNKAGAKLHGNMVSIPDLAPYKFGIIESKEFELDKRGYPKKDSRGKEVSHTGYRLYELSLPSPMGYVYDTPQEVIDHAYELLIEQKQKGETPLDTMNRGYGEVAKNHAKNVAEEGANIADVPAAKNPQFVPTVTNLSTLPAGQTTSGQEVTLLNTAIEPSATSGTSQTIPTDNPELMDKLTVTLDKMDRELGDNPITPVQEGTFQAMLYEVLKSAGIPRGAISGLEGASWYKNARGEKSFAKRVAMVKRAVEEYNQREANVAEQKERKVLLTSIADIQTKAVPTRISAASIVKIDAILSKYRKGKLTEVHREALEDMRASLENNPDVVVEAGVLKKLEALDRIALSSLSAEELRGLQKKLDSLYAQGKEELKAWKLQQVAQKKADVDFIVEHGKSLGKVMRGHPTGPISYVKKVGENIKMGELFRTTAMRLFKRLGLESLKRNFAEKYSHYHRINTVVDAQLNGIARKNRLKEKDMENITLYSQKMQGRGYVLRDVFGMTDKEIAELTLTKEQTELYDASRELFDQYFPKVQQVAAETYNKVVHFEENYSPLPMGKGQELDQQPTEERIMSVHTHTTKTVEQGMTVSRKLGAETKPEMNYLLNVKQYFRDAQYMIDCQPLLKRMYEAFGTNEAKDSLGEIGQALMQLWVDNQARQGGVPAGARIAALDKMVTKVTYGVMGWKIPTAFVQLTSIVDAIAVIGPENYMMGAVAMLNPKWHSFLKEQASTIFSGETRETELAPLLSMVGMKKASMEHIVFMDALVRRSNWLGAYYKYCSEHGLEFSPSIPKGEESAVRDALAYAGEMTTQAQGSSRSAELPLAVSAGAIGYHLTPSGLTIEQNKSIMRAVHHFGTFNLYRYNDIKDFIWTEGFAKGDWKKAMAGIFWLLIVGAIVEASIRRGYQKLREAMFSLEPIQDSFWKEVLNQTTYTVPFVSPITSMWNYGNDPLPILQSLRDAVAGTKSALTGKSSQTQLRGAMTALRGIGGLSGVQGAAQMAQLIKDLISSGTTTPAGKQAKPTKPPSTKPSKP